MKTKIRRRCKCGCGGIANYGKKYVHGHHRRDEIHSIESIKKMIGNTNGKGNKNKKRSKKTKKKQSISAIGNVNGKGNKGKRRSDETKVKQSISHIRYNPNDPYCDIWKDTEYKSDLRKDYCENVDCKGDYNRLDNHHIDLNKKNCNPKNIMTLCTSCHVILHNKLRDGKKIIVNPEDFLIINRIDRITYINKKTRKKLVELSRKRKDDKTIQRQLYRDIIFRY